MQPDPVIGMQLGNYVVRSLIGRGGMGAVYLAEHPEIGRKVAVKVLAPHLGHMPGLSDRFVAEARAASRVEHPSVITIFDFGRTPDGLLYQVMELLHGRVLSEVIADRAPFAAADVVPQNLLALHYLGASACRLNKPRIAQKVGARLPEGLRRQALRNECAGSGVRIGYD